VKKSANQQISKSAHSLTLIIDKPAYTMKAKAIFSLPLLLLISLFSACEEDDLRTISFEDSEVQYNRSITRMEANNLGRYLKDNAYFEKGNRQEVIISKDDLVYELKWEVDSDFLPHPEAFNYYYELADSVRKNVFTKNEVRMRLYSERDSYEYWELKAERPPYIKSKNHIIYYIQPANEEMAKEFGEILDAETFFDTEGEVFRLEQERNKIILGLAAGNRKSNEFKSKFSELRSRLVPEMEDKSNKLVFEIRGIFLNEIEESISTPFYPNSSSINGIKIQYDESVTSEDVQALRDFIRNKRLRSPDWIVFIRTDQSGTGRYKLIMPPNRSITDLEDIEKAKMMARAMSQKLLGSYVDVELLDESTGSSKLFKAESL
jgi:hypothetical protein